MIANKTSECPASTLNWELSAVPIDSGILYCRREESVPALCIRQAGERAILCVFGSGSFDLRIRARIQQLANEINKHMPMGFKKHPLADNMSILVYIDPHAISREAAIKTFLAMEKGLPSVEVSKIPSRTIHLPALFDPPECQEAVRKYMVMQRSSAAYLPDNVDFIRRSNGLQTKDDVKNSYFGTPHVVSAVGWMMGLPIYIALDPRKRLILPKYNPARTWTWAGSLGSGGNTSSIYPNDGPGGYMLWGVTLPACWDTYGQWKGATPGKPWVFEPFDQVIFHEVSRAEFDHSVAAFKSGLYQIQVEPGILDMAAYNQLLRSTAEEVAQIRKVQQECTFTELAKEKELYNEWVNQKKTEEAAKPPRPLLDRRRGK